MTTKIGWRAGLAFVTVLALVGGYLQNPVESRADERPAVLHFDGIYQSEKVSGKGKDYCYYLRFYEDGVVIAVSATGTAAEVGKWFDRKSDIVQRGTYVVTGTKIVFSAESKFGKVDYDGSMKGEQIEFSTYSHINKRRGVEKHTFVKFAEK